MDVKEKILLVQPILEDIRSNCGYGFYGKNAEFRALKAKSLCEEIATELNDCNYSDIAIVCDNYIEQSYRCGDWDGRYFRDYFPEGYLGMDDLHELDRTFEDKSAEFKSVAIDYLTYPEYAFDDWKEEFRY